MFIENSAHFLPATLPFQPDLVLGDCPRGKLPPTPKLTPSQTLTLTGGQLFSGAIVWLPPTLKLTLTLTQTPTLTRGQYVLWSYDHLAIYLIVILDNLLNQNKRKE